jgi:dephospho-CoA kinase
MKTVRIGLTGPIGCGKSTIAAWLTELGAVVIDADRVAHELTEPGTGGFEAVVAAFGPGVVRADGSLDRPALGRIVFDDPPALRRLELIIHPAVRPRILEAVLAAERTMAPAVVVEAIKLVEGGLATMCDEVWLVTCDRPPRDRVIARAWIPRRRTPGSGPRATWPRATRRLRPGSSTRRGHSRQPERRRRRLCRRADWRPRGSRRGLSRWPPGPRGGRAAEARRVSGAEDDGGRRTPRRADVRASAWRSCAEGDGLGSIGGRVATKPPPAGYVSGIGRPYLVMIRFVVAPSREYRPS